MFWYLFGESVARGEDYIKQLASKNIGLRFLGTLSGSEDEAERPDLP